jgi:hypothetical protein
MEGRESRYRYCQTRRDRWNRKTAPIHGEDEEEESMSNEMERCEAGSVADSAADVSYHEGDQIL